MKVTLAIRRFYYLSVMHLNSFIKTNISIKVLSRAPASGPGKEGKVEGSQLRLYKAKEGSRKHEALHA